MRFYVIDTHKGKSQTTVSVFDAASQSRIQEIPARYSPDITLSGDGHFLFVCDTQIGGDSPTSEIRVYDTANFDLVNRSPAIKDRMMYTIGPVSTRFMASRDGRYVFVPIMEQKSDGKFSYFYSVYDVKTSSFTTHAFQLPESAAFASILSGRPEIAFGLQGAELEAVAWANPLEKQEFDTVYTFDHPSERGTQYMMAQFGSSPEGNLVYTVTRNARLRIADLDNDKVRPEIKLRVPENSAVPVGDMLITQDYLLVPVSEKDVAARGLAQSVQIFDRWTLKLLRSIDLLPAGKHLALASDGSELYVSSYQDGSITTYDVKSGIAKARLNTGVDTLVWFTPAPNPR